MFLLNTLSAKIRRRLLLNQDRRRRFPESPPPLRFARWWRWAGDLLQSNPILSVPLVRRCWLDELQQQDVPPPFFLSCLNNAIAGAAARVSLKHTEKRTNIHAHAGDRVIRAVFHYCLLEFISGFIYLTYRDRGHCAGVGAGAEHYCAPFSFHLGYHLQKHRSHLEIRKTQVGNYLTL